MIQKAGMCLRGKDRDIPSLMDNRDKKAFRGQRELIPRGSSLVLFRGNTKVHESISNGTIETSNTSNNDTILHSIALKSSSRKVPTVVILFDPCLAGPLNKYTTILPFSSFTPQRILLELSTTNLKNWQQVLVDTHSQFGISSCAHRRNNKPSVVSNSTRIELSKSSDIPKRSLGTGVMCDETHGRLDQLHYYGKSSSWMTSFSWRASCLIRLLNKVN